MNIKKSIKYENIKKKIYELYDYFKFERRKKNMKTLKIK